MKKKKKDWQKYVMKRRGGGTQVCQRALARQHVFVSVHRKKMKWWRLMENGVGGRGGGGRVHKKPCHCPVTSEIHAAQTASSASTDNNYRECHKINAITSSHLKAAPGVC